MVQGCSETRIEYNFGIAILRLDVPVDIPSSCIPFSYEIRYDTTLKIGKIEDWEILNDTSKISKVVDIPINEFSSDNDIKILYLTCDLSFYIHNFCVEKISAQCQGDIGSGLYHEINGKFYLRGIKTTSCDEVKFNSLMYVDVFDRNVLEFIKKMLPILEIDVGSDFHGKYYTFEVDQSDENYKGLYASKINLKSKLYGSMNDSLKFQVVMNAKELIRFQRGLIKSTFPKLKEFEFQAITPWMASNPWSNLMIDEYTFDREYFESFENIETLSMSFFKFSEFKQDFFHDLTNLVNASFERVEWLGNFSIIDLFAKSPNLKKLHLFDCKIENLPNEPMRNNLKIEDLSFEKNKIEELPEIFFKNLNMKALNLKGNRISEISTNLFSNSPKLVYINLSQNRLNEIPIDFFKNQQELKEIHLKQNNISQIDQDQFSSLPKLTVIDLSHNQISEIPNDLFKSNPKLYGLYLNSNKISKFNFNISEFEDMHNLYLDSNECTDKSYGIFLGERKLIEEEMKKCSF